MALVPAVAGRYRVDDDWLVVPAVCYLRLANTALTGPYDRAHTTNGGATTAHGERRAAIDNEGSGGIPYPRSQKSPSERARVTAELSADRAFVPPTNQTLD